MSSGDFTFITLRNISAYQSNNAYVPNNYLLTMSTNGNARWTNHLNINTLIASTIVSNEIYATYLHADGIAGVYISTNVLTGNLLGGNEVFGELITGSMTRTDILSTLQTTISSIAMNPATYTTPTDYTNTGMNTVSSILINIGGTMWKIPIELA